MRFLAYQISRELGLTQPWGVVIVGAGNLGHALVAYRGFASRGFAVVGLLDSHPDVVGQTLGTPGAQIVVRPMADLESVVGEEGAQIGVIATPAESAQDVCDRLVAAGVCSILNFAPVVLTVPDGRRGPQGRPRGRAADPRVPRATPARRDTRRRRPRSPVI